MSEPYTTLNRQAQRSILAFQDALLELVATQPYHKITVTDLADRSGLTRSTFYAHFETKDDLLDSIIAGVLDEFFGSVDDIFGLQTDSGKILESNKKFFRLWRKNQHLFPLLDSLDFGCLMVKRLREYWQKLYDLNVKQALPPIEGNYSAYTLNFLAYAFTGFLKEWIHQGMQPSADLMGEMLYHFTGYEAMYTARDRFRHRFGMPEGKSG
jgi:AcrR family transcriptional regulator